MLVDYASKLVCEECGRQNMAAFVQYGSFLYRCLSCKALGPTTSFVSAKRSLSGSYEVIEVDNSLATDRTIFRGDINEGLNAIIEAANSGKLILLRKAKSIR